MSSSPAAPVQPPAPRPAGVASGLLALLYAGLTPLHLLVLTGWARPVMAVLAGISAVGTAALWVRWRSRPSSARWVELLVTVPLVNSLAHLGMTGEVQQTTLLMLIVVAIGAGVTSRARAAGLGGAACLGWLALLPTLPADQRAQVGHYAIQLAMAALLAVLLHEARRRREQALSDSESNLAAVSAVVRSIRTGEDARTAIVEAARSIAQAASVSLLERDGEHAIVVTRATGLDLAGGRVRLDQLSVTAHVWRTGEPLFLADPASSPMVSPQLLQLAQARSLMWQPVITRGEVTALLAVTWSHRVPDLSDRAARAVALLADETSVALEHDALLGDYARLAGTDQLTGLPNRRAWDERLPALMHAARTDDQPLVVALADLDHFKAYNDLFGHVQGDVLLRETATRFRRLLRGGDLVARWGGEEFAIVLSGCDPSAAQDVLSRLCASLPEGQTCSIGYAVYDGAEAPDTVLERADRALYDAKTAGRNRAVAALVS